MANYLSSSPSRMSATQGRSRGQKSGPSSQQWEDQRDICYQLYVEQDKSLAEVQEELARRGHVASHRMFKSRFAQWGIGKYTSNRDWQAFVILRAHAKAKGIDLREILIHNRIRSLPELQRYLRRQQISEEDFLREAKTAGVFVPDHVRSIAAAADKNEEGATTGEQNDGSIAKHPSLQRYHPDLISQNDNSNYSQGCTQHGARQSTSSWIPCENDDSSYSQSCTQYGAPQVTSTRMSSENEDSNFSQGCTQHGAPQLTFTRMSSKLSRYLSQVVDPSSAIMMPGPSYADLTELAESSVAYQGHLYYNNDALDMEANIFDSVLTESQGWRGSDSSNEGLNLGLVSQAYSDGGSSSPLPTPISANLPETTVLYVQRREHFAFMRDVFMACMSDAAKEVNDQVGLATKWMQKALIKVERFCAGEDPMFLVTTHTILAWLQVHDTESRAESLVREISQAVSKELGKGHLISLMLENMTAAAGKRLPSSRSSLDTMRQVVQDFSAQLGFDHPHTLVARYYMCFHMLRVERDFVEAEQELTKLYASTSNVLGKSSFQAVCVLATLSRAQSRQNKHYAALETINKCLREAPLGLNHPHRLDLLCRKAILCGHLMDKLKPEEGTERLYWGGKMEKLYWIVTKGRVATLGAYHNRTTAAHDSLVQILVDNGRYDVEAIKVETIDILKKPQVAVSAYESWWRLEVRKHREGEVRRAATGESVM